MAGQLAPRAGTAWSGSDSSDFENSRQQQPSGKPAAKPAVQANKFSRFKLSRGASAPGAQPGAPQQPAAAPALALAGSKPQSLLKQSPKARALAKQLPTQPRQQQQQQQQQQQGTKRAGALKKAVTPGPSKPKKVAQHAAAAAQASSDEEDDFVAGSLRQAPQERRATTSGPSAAAAAKPGAKRKRVWKTAPGLVLATGAASVADEVGAELWEKQVTSIKLQKDSLPGWPRLVTPYVPPQQHQPPTEAAAADRRVVFCDDVLAFDLASLGRGFQGILINSPPLVESVARPAASSSGAASPSSSAPKPQQQHQGITTTQLASLRLDDRVCTNGILCIWADKRHLKEIVSCMAGWGFLLVENLTWVQLGPNGQILKEPSDYIARSHLTLLMGRKGPPSALELRHQRTPDVIVTPALPQGQCPEEAYLMLETLLHQAAGRRGSEMCLLEIGFTSGGGMEAGRAGWVTLLQRDRE